MAVLVGVLAGSLIKLWLPEEYQSDFVADGLTTFPSHVFFAFLLPPIIFNSGYHLKRALFFRHITPISLYACIGTAISAVTVAFLLQAVVVLGWSGEFNPSFAELLTFGALISATDPVSTLAVFQQKQVDPKLFYLVFGESVINDAVGIVFFEAISKLVGEHDTIGQVMAVSQAVIGEFIIIFFGSLALGIFSGAASAIMFKVVDMTTDSETLELSLYLLVVGYFPYFMAELLGMSGIVTILFTGIAAKRYTVLNLSQKTASDAESIFKVAAYLAETSIFLYLGLAVAGIYMEGKFLYQFILWTVVACLVGRALNVYPITLVYNLSIKLMEKKHESRKISPAVLPAPPNEFELSMRSEQRFSGCEAGNANNDVNEHAKQSFTENECVFNVPTNTAHMLWFAGLRGAVAYACANNFPDANGNRESFILITMSIVLVTVFLLGSRTEYALDALEIEVRVDERKYLLQYPQNGPRSCTHKFESYVKNLIKKTEGSCATIFRNDTSETLCSDNDYACA